MYTVPPSDFERFCLRLLLLYTPGAKSFYDLRTVKGIVYNSFHKTALMRELLDDDNEWVKCMNEAIQWKMPRELRQLFAMILIWGNINNPLLLWDQYKIHLYEDLILNYSAEVTLLLTYQDIDKRLIPICKSLKKDFNISLLITTNIPSDEEHFDKSQEYRTGQKMYAQSNNAQQHIADKIMAVINGQSNDNKCFFIDGPGGTRKIFLYETLCYILSGLGIEVLTVAWTEIAANLLPGATTVHTNSKDAEIIKKAKVVIWDKAPMAFGQVLEVIEAGLRDLIQTKQLFGGKIMILGVISGKFCPQLEKHQKHKYLNKLEFAHWLLHLGNRTLPILNDEIEIPPQYITTNNLITNVFDNALKNRDENALLSTVILCLTNKISLEVCNEVIQKMHRQEKVFLSVDKMNLSLATDNCILPSQGQKVYHQYRSNFRPAALEPRISSIKKYSKR
ncbi:28029_t:CDS:2 [Dentiscutata erythropus]|uniref:ATP-dependent DNA helicase n=1 Tax=Dentiscutata erythropus TaxID=1348616 RepID=A0A9N9HDJ9_9GLOM|nr:28029_t:CDS:2 [Dentiscutata erythropus]